MSTSNNTSGSSSLWSILVPILLPMLPAFLAFVTNIFGRARDQQLIQAGIDHEIARQSEALFELTDSGKKMRARIDELNDEKTNDILRDLGKA